MHLKIFLKMGFILKWAYSYSSGFLTGFEDGDNFTIFQSCWIITFNDAYIYREIFS